MTITRRNVLALTSGAAGWSAWSSSASAQSSASSLERLQRSGVLRIGVTSAEPWFYKDPMTDQWRGVGIDLGNRLASDLGVKPVVVETSWANCVAALQADQIDVMFVLDPTPERRQAVDFPAAPLFYYAAGVLVQPNQTATSWSALNQPALRVGVTLGTSIDRTVTKALDRTTISRFPTNDMAVAAFLARRVDLVAQFHPALVVQYARLKLGKVILPTPVIPVATSAGLRKDPSPVLRDWMSAKFAAYYAAGLPETYFQSYLRSRGIDPAGVPGLIKESWG